jgi:hypothetical protein
MLENKFIGDQPPDRTGFRNGVAIALVAVGIGAYFASDAQIKKSDKAFQERGEFVPRFPFEPPPPFKATPESVGGPQSEATQGDVYRTEPHEAAMDSKSLEATLDDVARRLKKGGRP